MTGLFYVMGVFIAAGLGYCLACMMVAAKRGEEPFGPEWLRDAEFASTVADPAPQERDPWALQQMLMEASGQPMAERPTLTDTSLLYLALIAEELAETYEAAGNVLAREIPYGMLGPEQQRDLGAISITLGAMADRLKTGSLSMRKSIASLGRLDAPLTDDEAVDLFDGTTDIAVVNCGLALASGLDGSAGYLEVVGSNLSKIDPATGKIEKTPDGKWIKGPDFFKPDLLAVIRRCDLHQG